MWQRDTGHVHANGMLARYSLDIGSISTRRLMTSAIYLSAAAARVGYTQ